MILRPEKNGQQSSIFNVVFIVHALFVYAMKIVEGHLIFNFHGSSKSHQKAMNTFHDLLIFQY